MGYSDHAESTESKHSLRVERPHLELRSALCDVNEASLSCHSDVGDIPASKFTWTWTPL